MSDGGIVGFAVNRADTSLDVTLNSKGIPEFSAELEIEADVNAVQCPIDISQPAVIDELEKDIEDKYNINISKHIGLVRRRYGSDVLDSVRSCTENIRTFGKIPGSLGRKL